MSKLLIVAGEVSGDLYGATLASALLKQLPDLTLYGVGGDLLKRTCHEFVYETAYSHSVGLKGMIQFGGPAPLLAALERFLSETDIDRVVLIDFQHQNFALARLFGKFNIPITTFITPNFWIWRDLKQAKKIAAYSDQIITIFEREYELYAPLHPKVYYFGHPLVDIVQAEKQSFPFIALPPNATKHITLFPGSREQEIHLLFSKMLETASILHKAHPSFKFNLALSTPRLKPLIDRYLRATPQLPIQFWQTNKPQLFQQTDMLLCASGSATLEAILYQVPMVIFCALPPLTFWFAKYILQLKMPHISLPNIIARAHMVTEKVQSDIQPLPIAREVEQLLTHKREYWHQCYSGIIRSMTPYASPITQITSCISDTLV